MRKLPQIDDSRIIHQKNDKSRTKGELISLNPVYT